jgi:hypothetical protein
MRQPWTALLMLSSAFAVGVPLSAEGDEPKWKDRGWRSERFDDRHHRDRYGLRYDDRRRDGKYRDGQYDRDWDGKRDDDKRRYSRYRDRTYSQIPPGHLPPPGECRTWYPGVPPGHQPPPHRC